MPLYKTENVYEQDLPGIYQLASRVSEQFVMPTLSHAGQQALRQSQKEHVRDIVFKENYQARKIISGNKIVAYIAWRDDNHVAQLFVEPEYQGHGLGKMLLDEVVKLCHSPTLKVRASLNAVGFYEKYGFQYTGDAEEVNNITFMPMEYILPSL